MTATPVALGAQSGPWARSSDKLKGEALVRDSDGGYLREVQSIVAGGGDVNWRLEPTGLTPLMAAASGGHAEVVRFLLAQGADPALRDAQGLTALDRAVRAGANDVVRLLRGSAIAPAAATPLPAPAAAPAAATPPAARPDAATATTARGANAATDARWAPFGSFQPGDRVRFHLSTGWRSGTVREVGVAGGAPRTGQPRALHTLQYRVADDRYRDAGDWHDVGRVAGPDRAPWWTAFFTGDWRLGETMAVNSRVAGSVETTTYSYGAATDALRVSADGSYRWKRTGAAELRGRWAPALDGPGIVLRRGPGGADWTLRNETNGIELGIRGLETARLTAPGVMSIAAKRPAPAR